MVINKMSNNTILMKNNKLVKYYKIMVIIQTRMW